MSTTDTVREDLGRPPAEVLRALLDTLLRTWEDVPEQARMLKDRTYGPDLVMTVIGFAAHAHRLGRAVEMLIDHGFGVETVPTVRSVLEYGLTAHWVAQYGNDALFAIMNEESRQRLAAAEMIEKLPDVMSLAGAEGIVRGLREDIRNEKTTADANTRNLQQLCRDLVEGDSIYLAYRVLSGYVHPGPTIAGMYRASNVPPVVQLEPRTGGDDATTWLYHTCSGLVWAERAADMLDRAHPRREQLRAAAKTLGIPVEIHLSDTAVMRRARDQAERKRARKAERGAASDGAMAAPTPAAGPGPTRAPKTGRPGRG